MISVTFNKVSKSYAVSAVNKRQRLKSRVFKKWFGLKYREPSVHYREALSDISFSVKKGEALAFIGRNGAGKSTLLKIVNGSLQPDSGEVEVVGRVGGLIELGAGFDPTKTGYENAIERARLLRVEKIQVSSFVSAIEEFSELKDQFYEPVNTYSSGMKARLGFAVSVTLPFDIMICDEALSVGDAGFSAKCLAKINELKKERVFLFVSHSMTQVQRFCDIAIVIDSGNIKFSGESKGAVAFYENNILHLEARGDEELSRSEKEVGPKKTPSSKTQTFTPSYLQPILHNVHKVKEWGVQVEQDDSGGLVINWSFLLGRIKNGQLLRLGFPVFSADGVMVMSCTNENLVATGSESNGTLIVSWHGLNPGVYSVVVALYDELEPVLRQCFAEIIIKSKGEPVFGIYNVPHEWLLSN